MANNLDILRSKVSDKTLELVKNGNLADIEDSQFELVKAIKRERVRQEKIAALESERKQEITSGAKEFAKTPLGMAATFGEGVGNWLPGYNTVMSLDDVGKNYYQKQQDLELYKDALKEENPALNVAGAGTAIGLQAMSGLGAGLAPVAAKSPAAAKMLGTVLVGPKALQVVQGGGWKKAAKQLAATGALYGALEPTKGASNFGEDVVGRGKSAIGGAIAAPLLGGATNLAIKGGVGIAKKTNELMYGLPAKTVDAIFKNPKLMSGDSSEAILAAKELTSDVQKEYQEAVNVVKQELLNLENSTTPSVDVSNVFKLIDDKIQKAQSMLSRGLDVKAQEKLIAKLDDLKKDVLIRLPEVRHRFGPESTMTGIEDVTTTVPAQTESNRFWDVEYQDIDAESQPGKRLERFLKSLEDDFDVEFDWKAFKKSSPEVQKYYRKYFDYFVKKHPENLKAVMKKAARKAFTPENVAAIEKTIEREQINKLKGSHVFYDERTYTHPEEVAVTSPEYYERIETPKGPASSQLDYGASEQFRKNLEHSPLLSGQNKELGDELQKAVVESQMKFPKAKDLLTRKEFLEKKVAPDVLKLTRQGEAINADNAYKVMDDIASGDQSAMHALELLYGKKGAQEIQQEAAKIHATMFFGKGATPNIFAGYRNPTMRFLSGPAKKMFGFTKFIEPMSMGSAVITSRPGIKAVGKLSKSNEKITSGMGKVAGIMSGKINFKENE
jgi:hypothetical protein